MARPREVNASGANTDRDLLPPKIVITQTNSNGDPTSWTENGVQCSASYNVDGTISSITKGRTTMDYTYQSGRVVQVSE